jgi:endonuclease YncB( thermonuclease family)
MKRSEKHKTFLTNIATGIIFFISQTIIGTPHDFVQLSGIVEDVVDGDTITVRLTNNTLETVRFWGIDAPESYVKRFGYEEFLGKEAYHFTRKLLSGKKVIMQTKKKNDSLLRDKYRRLLAFVWENNRDISILLLKEGLAKVYRKSKSPRFHEFVQIEKEAASRKIGIWDKEAERAYYHRQFEKNKNRFLIIWFWEHDKEYLKKLLYDSSAR